MNSKDQEGAFPLVAQDSRELVSRMDRSLELVERALAEHTSAPFSGNAGDTMTGPYGIEVV